MRTLLHIDSSPRSSRSRSRWLTKQFVNEWLESHPTDTVVYRDVARSAPPYVDETWVAAAFTPTGLRTAAMQRALQVSEELVDEFVAADTYVCGVPMYNFSVPANFKGYIDQIVRLGRTFGFNPDDPAQPYKPLLRNKKMFVIVTAAVSGYEEGGSSEKSNHVDPYLRTVFGFVGITDIRFIHVRDDELVGQHLADSLAKLRTSIAAG